MKKIWKYAILLVALSALLCMSAFAADELKVNNFVEDAVAAVEGEEYFTATYNAGEAAAGSQYLILMLAGTETGSMPDPTDGNILYVNQAQAGEDGVVKFETVYPMALEDSVIWLTGGPKAVALASIDVPDPVGVTVSGTIAAHATGKDTWLSGDTTVTLTKKGEATALQTVTLTTDKGISVSNGASAETVSFDAVENGTYIVKVAKAHFAPIEVEVTVNGTAVTLDNIDLYMWGDVSMDGAVDVYDATLIKRHSVGIITLDNAVLLIGEVSNDDVVDVYDATLIQRFAVEIISAFPVDSN